MASYDLLRYMNSGHGQLTTGNPLFGGERDAAGGAGGGQINPYIGSWFGMGKTPAQTQADLANQESQRQRDFQAQQNELNRQTTLAPLLFRQQLFDKLYPSLSGFLGGGTTSRVGGTPAPQPAFTPSPVYSQDQIGQQVNSAVASNDQRYATQGRQLNDSQAVRGFGNRSPAAEAMRRSLGMANASEDATAEREIPFQAAKANSDSMFRGNQLQQQMWTSAEDSDIRRRQQQLSGFTSLLGLI